MAEEEKDIAVKLSTNQKPAFTHIEETCALNHILKLRKIKFHSLLVFAIKCFISDVEKMQF